MTYLYKKNRVSDQCPATVRHMPDGLNLSFNSIEPGRVEMQHAMDNTAQGQLQERLKKAVLALFHDGFLGCFHQIKSYIMKLIHHRKGEHIDVFFRPIFPKK